MTSNVPAQANQPDHNYRLCDFCNLSKAVLHCRADSANLCLSCDRQVHSTNPLFTKHHRSLLCNSCGSSPSSIFCCTESTVLCQNCDWETHKGFSSEHVHDRRPLEGFSGVPTLNELLGFLGLDCDSVKKKSLDLGNGINVDNDDDATDEGLLLDMFVWETPMVVGFDDLIVGCADDDGGGGMGLKAMGAPPLPKNRNAVCGKDKEEIISQLREMAKTEPDFENPAVDFETHMGPQQPQVPAKFEWTDTFVEQPSVPSYEENVSKWYDFTTSVLDESFSSSFLDSFVETNHIVPDKDSEAGNATTVIADCTAVQEVRSHDLVESSVYKVPLEAVVREFNSEERDSALSRYKEKKKTRRYDKHIRYESRKVRAESRTRIKGRFAKMDR